MITKNQIFPKFKKLNLNFSKNKIYLKEKIEYFKKIHNITNIKNIKF